jgi:hypothetical protein
MTGFRCEQSPLWTGFSVFGKIFRSIDFFFKQRFEIKIKAIPLLPYPMDIKYI